MSSMLHLPFMYQQYIFMPMPDRWVSNPIEVLIFMGGIYHASTSSIDLHICSNWILQHQLYPRHIPYRQRMTFYLLTTSVSGLFNMPRQCSTRVYSIDRCCLIFTKSSWAFPLLELWATKKNLAENIAQTLSQELGNIEKLRELCVCVYVADQQTQQHTMFLATTSYQLIRFLSIRST